MSTKVSVTTARKKRGECSTLESYRRYAEIVCSHCRALGEVLSTKHVVIMNSREGSNELSRIQEV